SAVVLPLPRSEAADLARLMLADDLLDVPLQESLKGRSDALPESDLLSELLLSTPESSPVPTSVAQEREKYG
nr:hypothetical protein [Herpetosiphonaceae bacterium]